MQSRRQSTRSNACRRNSGTWRTSNSGLSSPATIHRYFASDNCPWPSKALANVNSSAAGALLVGHVTLAADGQQQRVNAGGVDRVDRPHARYLLRYHRPDQLVNQLAEDRVLLRRPADDRKRPNRVRAMIHVLDPHQRKIVLQAVIAQMIAERPFGLQRAADRGSR